MPYSTEQTPVLGDHVEHLTGRMGKITSVALNQGNLRGEDSVRVQWNDGGTGISMALAREFNFIRKPDPSESASFFSICPECNESRSITGDRDSLKVSAEKNEPIRLGSVICGHSWPISEDEKQNLHKAFRSGAL